jgi:hypothetical protein
MLVSLPYNLINYETTTASSTGYGRSSNTVQPVFGWQGYTAGHQFGVCPLRNGYFVVGDGLQNPIQ